MLENSHIDNYPFAPFPLVLAAGALHLCPVEPGDSFASVGRFHQRQQDWLFGFFGYDLKNELEEVQSHHPDSTGFPAAAFFVPDVLVFFKENTLEIHSALASPQQVFTEITGMPPLPRQAVRQHSAVRQVTSRREYLQKVRKIKEHIHQGNVYELNYCIEFIAKNTRLDPAAAFCQLNRLSPMPFACFLRMGQHYLISASPERFLKKQGSQLISQPIKGTAPRSTDPAEDLRLKTALRHSEKERAENMMIVDLVRNDLARSARTGTVAVPEIFGIYSFRQVHQMISTVTAELRADVPWWQAIAQAFPMGSMTGAPKIAAMKIIEELENSRRGLYSGAAGYVSPDADFDFNVVIRSLLYNSATGTASFQAGSAITWDATPEQEYEECLLKTQAMLRLFNRA